LDITAKHRKGVVDTSSGFRTLASIIALMMEAVRTSETSVNFNLTTRCYIPEDSKLHIAAVRT
jgi:hypothetical protein